MPAFSVSCLLHVCTELKRVVYCVRVQNTGIWTEAGCFEFSESVFSGIYLLVQNFSLLSMSTF